MMAISQRSSEEILLQQCTKSESPFLHDGDLGSRQRPRVVCIEFADSSGVRTLTPLTDDSGVNSHAEFQKRASGVAVPAAECASGVVQPISDGSLWLRPNPAHGRESFSLAASGIESSQ